MWLSGSCINWKITLPLKKGLLKQADTVNLCKRGHAASVLLWNDKNDSGASGLSVDVHSNTPLGSADHKPKEVLLMQGAELLRIKVFKTPGSLWDFHWLNISFETPTPLLGVRRPKTIHVYLASLWRSLPLITVIMVTITGSGWDGLGQGQVRRVGWSWWGPLAGTGGESGTHGVCLLQIGVWSGNERKPEHEVLQSSEKSSIRPQWRWTVNTGCSADFSSSLQLTCENRKACGAGSSRKAPLRSQKAKGVWVKVAGCRSRPDWGVHSRGQMDQGRRSVSQLKSTGRMRKGSDRCEGGRGGQPGDWREREQASTSSVSHTHTPPSFLSQTFFLSRTTHICPLPGLVSLIQLRALLHWPWGTQWLTFFLHFCKGLPPRSNLLSLSAPQKQKLPMIYLYAFSALHTGEGTLDKCLWKEIPWARHTHNPLCAINVMPCTSAN